MVNDKMVNGLMLAVIINPKSGKSFFRAQRLYLWRLMRSHGVPFVYRVTKYAAHATEEARELVEQGYRRILVLGGDGTLSEVINGIMEAKISDEERRKVAVGLMPRGTGNDWGRYWGLDKHYQRSLQRFFHSQDTPVDVGCITYLRNGEEHRRWFINSLGFGIDSLTCVNAEKLKPYIGSHHVNYFFGLLKALLHMKPIPMSLSVDGPVMVRSKLYHMSIGNGPFSGGGIRQNPTADPRDGVLNGIFVEKPTFRQVMQALPRLFDGRLNDLPFIHTFQGTDFRLDTKAHLLFEGAPRALVQKIESIVNCLKIVPKG